METITVVFKMTQDGILEVQASSIAVGNKLKVTLTVEPAEGTKLTLDDFQQKIRQLKEAQKENEVAAPIDDVVMVEGQTDQ